MTDTYDFREHVAATPDLTDERRTYLLSIGPSQPVVGKSKPFDLDRYGERVFYVNFDEHNPLFCEWTGDTHLNGLNRDVDYRCEDAGWPQTPPGMRMIYARKEDADAMVARWKDRINVAEDCQETPPWTYADPDHYGYGW
jgi:hypothetical protein